MAGMLSSQNMKKLLAKASLKLDLEKKDKLEKLHGSSVSGTQFKFLSAINSAFLSNTKTEKLDSPVTFAFSHLVSIWVGRGDQFNWPPHSQRHSGPSTAFVS